MTASTASHSETNIVDTLQSLTVAFALAMTVRSFVTEGFVIPTGSMAPTLLGAHTMVRSPETGFEYPFDYTSLIPRLEQSRVTRQAMPISFADPMINPSIGVQKIDPWRFKEHMGDRVLVLKFLYLVQEPRRWDVVVFKNPTDPIGDTQNYIKRLIGLPNERLLSVDGDIWTAPLSGAGEAANDLSTFRIQRKPEHVQRAVWQLVHDSDYAPVDPAGLARRMLRSYEGAPWIGPLWDTSTAAYRCETAEANTLSWKSTLIPIDDRATYNYVRQGQSRPYSVSDIRVVAAIEADSPEALRTEFALEARSHSYSWAIANGKVVLSLRKRADGSEVARTEANFAMPSAGQPCEVEFWHVDQAMSVWLNGVEVANLAYDQWSVEDRVRFSFPETSFESFANEPVNRQPEAPLLSWNFSGSPLNLHHVRVYRDLYYRPAIATANEQCATNGPAVAGLAFGSDLAHPAELKADQFLLMGDNSAFSRDGRVWGRPHPLVVDQLGVDAPFIVPRPLLLGPGWSVYFPAPYAHDAKPNLSVVPNFGKLRFIR
jgi:signal peptidase I